jgi:hypothetical protein
MCIPVSAMPLLFMLPVKGLYELNSFGQVEFAGDIEGSNQWDIFGPFKINYNLDDKQNCEPEVWAGMADELATLSGLSLLIATSLREGVQLRNYQHRVYAIPRKTDDWCRWEGLGYMGCGLFCRCLECHRC